MFKCDCCGLCCRNIAGIKILEAFNDGSGTCIYLDREENLCTIYASRPAVCNVDAMYELLFRQKMTREEFYALNHEACMKLKHGRKN